VVSYVKLDDRLPHHRKVRALHPKLALAALGLYTASIAFSQRDETDGRVRLADLHIMLPTTPPLPLAQLQKLVAELVRVGLWDAEADGWRIHDYLDWNLSAEERKVSRLANASRQKRHRDILRENAGSRGGSNASLTGPTPLRSSPLHSTPLRSSPLGPPEGLSALREAEAREDMDAFHRLVAETSARMGFRPDDAPR